jgi:predicted DNA-binding protein
MTQRRHQVRDLNGVSFCVYVPIQGKTMESVRRNITIPAALDRELAAVSKALGITRSSVIAKALANYLDILDLDIARERVRLLDEGKTRTLTSKQLRRPLALQAVAWCAPP